MQQCPSVPWGHVCSYGENVCAQLVVFVGIHFGCIERSPGLGLRVELLPWGSRGAYTRTARASTLCEEATSLASTSLEEDQQTTSDNNDRCDQRNRAAGASLGNAGLGRRSALAVLCLTYLILSGLFLSALPLP